MSSTDKAGGLEIQHRYPHTIGKVFKAWSDPTEIKSWWGPKAFTATKFDCDFREGGEWQAVIVGPDDKQLNQSGRYTRIERDKVIAFTFRWDDGDSPQTDVTVEFAAEGDKTLVTFRQAPFESDESRSSHEEGWRECLDRLEKHMDGDTQ
mgnify:CR=1 FL=1